MKRTAEEAGLTPSGAPPDESSAAMEDGKALADDIFGSIPDGLS